MSIALTTILLFIFVFPVTVANRAYSSGELSYKFTKSSILDEILKSVFSSLVFHLLTIKFVSFLGYEIDYQFIKSLIIQSESSQLDLSILSKDWLNIISYFFLLFCISFAFFYLVRNLIRYFKIDRKWDFLRYDNFWYYLLSAEVLQIKEYNQDNNINLSSITRYVDVLTKSEKGNVIYSGALVEYQLAENDSLEFIVLATPKKQIIKENRLEEESRIIPSKYFVIPYKEILNFNIIYKQITLDN